MRRLLVLGAGTAGTIVVTPLGDTAAHLPQRLGGIPGMTAIATHMMKKQIADVGVPEVPEFLEQIVASGGHCRPAACRPT